MEHYNPNAIECQGNVAYMRAKQILIVKNAQPQVAVKRYQCTVCQVMKRRRISGYKLSYSVAYAGFLNGGVSVTSHRDDVKILHYNCSSLEILKCIVL